MIVVMMMMADQRASKKGLLKTLAVGEGKSLRCGLVFARANTPTPHYMNAKVQHQHDPSWFFLLEILRGRRDESKGTRVKWKEERARAVLIHQAASSSISRRPFIILEAFLFHACALEGFSYAFRN
jgi:hypothetical protein